jgi:predicted RNase H-like HicB family nuclease
VATTTVVEDYMLKAVRQAEFEWLEDGSCAAWVPGFPGLIALGVDGQSCLQDLWKRLDLWLRSSLETGLSLPVIDGIDFSAGDDRERLVEHSARLGPVPRGKIYESDDELFRALDGEP